jgi:hypothetical protein
VSVRDLIARIRREVINGGLTPTRTGEIAAQLSALLGNICDEIRDAEMAYNAKVAELLDELGKANRAEMKGKLTPEYLRLREAEDTEKVTQQMILSLRKLQDTANNEMRLQR